MTTGHIPLILATCWGKNSPPSQPPVGGAAGVGANAAQAANPVPPVRWETLPAAYAESVSLAGGAPVLLPNSEDPAPVAASMEAADGLLLTGGGDVAAELYGRAKHPSEGGIDPLRDATEKLAIEIALRRGLPILAVCRGIQILNVALGGTLIQDIPSHHASAGTKAPLVHRGTDHEVRIQRGSILHELWGRERGLVNSSHHQAIDAPARALKVTAWAADGIIEAAESAEGLPVLAVQFHPERLAACDPAMLAPFRWLVNRCGSRCPS